MKNLACFLILALAACGGTDPTSFRTGDDSGAGGDDEGEAGGDSVSSSSTGSEKGAGGAGTGTSSSTADSSGSGQCQPSVSCQSVGAECGTILDDGCGNEIECPNNCTGNLTCGGGGDQFKCGCTALTCLDLGANCGTADDGCGGVIECGTCGDDPYVSCGGDDAPTAEGDLVEGTDNVCAGGCTRQTGAGSQDCVAAGKPDFVYFCSDVSATPPFNECEALDPNEFGETIVDTWCCSNP